MAVHQKTGVACRRVLAEHGNGQQDLRPFKTRSADRLRLADWRRTGHGPPVALASTGGYWKPIFNMVEGELEVLCVDQQHLKFVPGRKPDDKDAQWIAQRLPHGLLNARFIPPLPPREVRERYRHGHGQFIGFSKCWKMPI